MIVLYNLHPSKLTNGYKETIKEELEKEYVGKIEGKSMIRSIKKIDIVDSGKIDINTSQIIIKCDITFDLILLPNKSDTIEMLISNIHPNTFDLIPTSLGFVNNVNISFMMMKTKTLSSMLKKGDRITAYVDKVSYSNKYIAIMKFKNKVE